MGHFKCEVIFLMVLIQEKKRKKYHKFGQNIIPNLIFGCLDNAKTALKIEIKLKVHDLHDSFIYVNT